MSGRGSILLTDGPAKGRQFLVPLLPCGRPASDWPVQDTNGHSIYAYAWNGLPGLDGVFGYVFVREDTPAPLPLRRVAHSKLP